MTRLRKDELTELLEIAKHAAGLAATIHRRAIDAGQVEAETKRSSSDLVTNVDRESEHALVNAIHAARPNDSILAEEGTSVSGNSGARWIIDPLDGTTNFIHRYPFHSVAVGVEVDGKNVAGVVHDTFNDHVYAGLVGYGATCEDKQITVRKESELRDALIGTGFLPDEEVRKAQAELLREVLPRVRDVRRSGCPSLDICSVASGALSGFYECGLGPWDIAAAAAVAEAAGATVSLLHSSIFPNPFLIVANPELSSALIQLFVDAKVVDWSD
jgi:myo-inositol-1(or 4)-monophosphatase